MRQRMSLEAPVDVPDPSGGFLRNWQAVSDVWASVSSAPPRPRLEAARQDEAISHRITIRWRPDISAAMRLSDGSGDYLIHGAHDADGKRRFLICYCEQVLS